MEKMYKQWETSQIVEVALAVARIFTPADVQEDIEKAALNAFEAAKKDPKKMAKILELLKRESGYCDGLTEEDAQLDESAVYRGFEYFLGYYR